MTREGWICPKCQRGVSPAEKTCPCEGGLASLNELVLRQSMPAQHVVVTVVPGTHTRTLPWYSSNGDGYPPWYGYA